MGETRLEVQDILSRPFPKEKVKQKRGQGNRVMAYISHGLVTERLNEADPGWSSQIIKEHTYMDGQGRLHCEGVTISLTVDGVTRVEAGGPQRQDGFTNEIKNAYSDALKRAAMRFGVALEMWESLLDAEGDEDYDENHAAPESRPAARVAQFSRDPVRDASRPVERTQNGDGGPRPQAGPGQITEPQKKLLNGLLSRKGVEDVPDFLWQRFQEESIEPLTKQQASRAIDELQTWPDRQRVEQPVGQGVFRGMPEPAEPDEDGYVN